MQKKKLHIFALGLLILMSGLEAVELPFRGPNRSEEATKYRVVSQSFEKYGLKTTAF